MKKMLMNFSENLISRNEISKIKGSCGDSTCTIKCYDAGDQLLGTIDGRGDCIGGDECCRQKYTTFDNATCYCN